MCLVSAPALFRCLTVCLLIFVTQSVDGGTLISPPKHQFVFFKCARVCFPKWFDDKTVSLITHCDLQRLQNTKEIDSHSRNVKQWIPKTSDGFYLKAGGWLCSKCGVTECCNYCRMTYCESLTQLWFLITTACSESRLLFKLYQKVHRLGWGGGGLAYFATPLLTCLEDTQPKAI